MLAKQIDYAPPIVTLLDMLHGEIRQFGPLDLLEELEKTRPDAALEAVEEAERAHLVNVEICGRQSRCRFIHELVRQTLAETLSLPRRQRLHARIAEAMERVYESSIETHISALAHHLYQAGVAAERKKTIHFLGEAATRASAAAAHEEALDHLNKAISLLDNERTIHAAEFYARRAFALRSLSRNQEATEEYERALDLFESLEDHVRFIETCVSLWSAHVWAGRCEEANALAVRAAQCARGASATIRGTTLAIQATGAAVSGATDSALALLEELHRIPDNELTTGATALACICEVHARHLIGDYLHCAAAARKGTRIFQQTGDVWWEADVHAGLVLEPLHCGRPAEAEKLLREIIPRAARVAHDHARCLALVYLVTASIDRGDFDSAEQRAREAIALGKSCSSVLIFIAETVLGTVLLYRGQTEESLSLLAKANCGPFMGLSGYTEGMLAWAMTATEREGAMDACDAALRCLPPPGAARSAGAWYAILNLTQALCLGGRRAEAGNLQAEAEKIAAEWDCNDFGFPVRTAAGIAAACAGNWARAEEHHRAAIARMDSVPYVAAQPIAHYWYADMLAARRQDADVETAKAQLQMAIAASNAIGLLLYTRLARQRFVQLA